MRLLLFSLMALASLAGPASADRDRERPVVLELFVSQNCGACPTANETMASLASTRADVLALTYDVDYWDYLGWRDTLAHPAFTARQRAYADRFGQARVYTPQMIVDGREAGPGGDQPRITSDIRICRESAASAPSLTARREGAEIAVEIGAGDAPAAGADIWLIGFRPGHVTTHVKGGENRGREFTVINPVRDVRRIGAWRGEAARLRARAPDTPAFAVLVQEAAAGPVLTAASGH